MSSSVERQAGRAAVDHHAHAAAVRLAERGDPEQPPGAGTHGASMAAAPDLHPFQNTRSGTSLALRWLPPADPPPTPSSSGVPASTTSATSPSSCPRDRLIVFTGPVRAPASRRSRSTPSTPRASAATSSRCRPTPASSWARWTSPTSTSSRACRRPSRSTRSRASRNPRSTVGTITEIYDYLRLLFARIGVPHCPRRRGVSPARRPSRSSTGSCELPEGTRFQVLAPVVRGRKGTYEHAARRPGRPGLRPRPGRRRGPRAAGGARPGPLRAAHHRGHRRPPRAARGHRAPPDRLLETALQLAEGVAEVEIVPRKDGDRPRRREPELLTFASTSPARSAARASRSWPPATSRSTRPTAPARAATASARGSRSTPSWSCPTPTCRSPRAPSPRGPPATPSTSTACSSRSAPSTTSTRTLPWRALPKKQQKLLLYGAGDGSGSHVQVQEPLRPHPLLHRPATRA